MAKMVCFVILYFAFMFLVTKAFFAEFISFGMQKPDAEKRNSLKS